MSKVLLFVVVIIASSCSCKYNTKYFSDPENKKVVISSLDTSVEIDVENGGYVEQITYKGKKLLKSPIYDMFPTNSSIVDIKPHLTGIDSDEKAKVASLYYNQYGRSLSYQKVVGFNLYGEVTIRHSLKNRTGSRMKFLWSNNLSFHEALTLKYKGKVIDEDMAFIMIDKPIEVFLGKEKLFQVEVERNLLYSFFAKDDVSWLQTKYTLSPNQKYEMFYKFTFDKCNCLSCYF